MNNKVRPTAGAGSTQREVTRSFEHDRGASSVGADEYAIDLLAERFFSQDALYPPTLDLDDERTRNVRSSKRAMHVTFVMLAVSALTLVAFLLYMRLIMPVPEELGRGGPLAVPGANELPPSAAALVTTATASVLRDVDLGLLVIARPLGAAL